MPIDRGPWNTLIDDDGSNTVGSLWNKAAIKTVLLDPIDAIPWIPVTYAPANFGWAVDAADVKTNRYTVIGKTLIWALRLTDTVAGVSGNLLLWIPGGYLAAAQTVQPLQLHDGGVWKIGAIETTAGAGTLAIRQVNYAGVAAGAVFLDFVISLEVS